jgi:hypothetical protein
MRHNFNFIRTHKEFEPINDSYHLNKSLAEDYKSKENSRVNILNKIVYDCNDLNSPYYPIGEYIPSDK